MRGYHSSPNMLRSLLFDASENLKSSPVAARYLPSSINFSQAFKAAGLSSNMPDFSKSGDLDGDADAACTGVGSLVRDLRRSSQLGMIRRMAHAAKLIRPKVMLIFQQINSSLKG